MAATATPTARIPTPLPPAALAPPVLDAVTEPVREAIDLRESLAAEIERAHCNTPFCVDWAPPAR